MWKIKSYTLFSMLKKKNKEKEKKMHFFKYMHV